MKFQIVYRTRKDGPRVRTLVEAKSEHDARRLALAKSISYIEDVRPASDVWNGPDFDATVDR
jgi:hypothetical protein